MNINFNSETSNLRPKTANLQLPAIALILAAFIVLGITYSLVTPVFEAPDEIYHYFFIKHLADGKGLPVQNPESPGLWEQEGSQPPLYYLIGALATFWSDTSDAEGLLWYNPQRNVGRPLDPGNKNVIVHTQRESFPFQGTVLAVHLVRLLSVLLGAGTVFLTYRLALEVFPDHEHLAVGAAALNAFIPQFLFISGAINNDNLVVLLCSLALLMMLKIVNRKSNIEYRTWVLLGLVLGLACLSKLGGLGLLILTAMISAVEARRRRSARPLVGGLIALAVAVAVAGWWYVRNWTLYGDPTGLNMMLDVVGRGSPPSSLSELWGEFRGLRMSFWALFGWFSILVAPAAYAILDAVSLFALAGLGVWFVRQWKKRWESTPKPLIVLTPWLAIVSLGLVRWTWTTPASQGRLLFPAISAISTLLMLGLSQLVPARYTKTFVSVMSLVTLVFAAVCPFLYIAPAYARPPVISPDQVPPGVVHDFGEKIRLLGCQLDREEGRPGETLGITFYWQGLGEIREDYYLFIHLLGRRGQLVGNEDTYPGWGTYPTSLWKPAGNLATEIIADTYRLPISEDALAPSLIRVDVGLYEPITGSRLEPHSVVIGQVKLVPKKRQTSDVKRQDFNLDNKVTLIGYQVDKAELRPGQAIRLTLYWQAEGEMSTDYTVFTHLIDEEGIIWGQMDSQPLEGDYPTSFWDIGEVIEDEYILSINEDTPTGAYRLEVGMYELATKQRLPVLNANGEIEDNRILLPVSITVKRIP
jgi:4-amino-4-deoxy-L-arabinose transferase-like glycosyltransferase